MVVFFRTEKPKDIHPSKIEWDLTNGPLRKLLELLDTHSGLGVHSVGPAGDFLESRFP